MLFSTDLHQKHDQCYYMNIFRSFQSSTVLLDAEVTFVFYYSTENITITMSTLAHRFCGTGKNAQQCPSPCVWPSCYGTPSASHSEPKLSYIICSANEIQALTNPDLVPCYPGHCLYINKHWVPCCIK